MPPFPRRLLVVDDEPHIGFVLRPYLEELGYEVSFARTLTEARAALGWPPDAVLLDLHLPDGSGLSFLQELRGARATASLPVVVLTGEGDDPVLEQAGRLGAELVTKPFSPSKLTRRLAALLGDRPASPEGGTA